MAINQALRSLWSRIGAAVSALDIRDFFVFGGLALLGSGLWMLAPWLALIIVGALMFLMGRPFPWRAKP